jgi:energy-coupling factor transporter ATP-binding protein EcfA2
VSFIKPLCVCFARALIQIVSLEDLRCWPLPVVKLIGGITAIVGAAGRDLTSLLERQLKGAGHHPLQVAFKVCILAALLAVAYLPSLEKRRKILPSDDEEEDSDEAALKMAEQISSLGSSSASRLSFQSKRGWAESAIERWRLLQDESSVVDADSSIGSLVRRLGYYIASWVILAAPLLIFGFFLRTPMTGWSATPMSPWQASLEVSVLLLFTNGLVWQAMTKVVESRDLDPDIPGFLESLAQASTEMTSQNASARPLMGSVTPAAGLMVKDFWSAHVYRRGWAVRGAHLSCRSGEVVVVLGDDGSGKSRLLTALAESLVSPPKQSLTVTKVRGSVAVGGIDVAQWERKELRKRVGVCLTDVNTLSLRAGLWSGMSLEEILEPGDGLLKVADPTHTSGPIEKSCVVLALKITGLYWSLLPRLPSKLSTILTANEEELRPSPLRPRYHLVSPTDWSKLLVAQVLAQAIYDNDNTSGSADRFENRLVGSILLLDDGTNMLSEIEESNLLRDLRRTGVATVLSSNKWATGRLADRIAVVKDGAIIETGTHHELLSRGPQQSWYAAKWNAMTGS